MQTHRQNKIFKSLLKSKSPGFTLIELLVVISIISLISSIILVSVSKTRAKAKDTKRRADLSQLTKALELYYEDNGHYPCTKLNPPACPGPFANPVVVWWGTCGDAQFNYNNNGAIGTSGPTGYIPDLAPKYVLKLPVDTDQKSHFCYLYQSDGIDYKVMAFNTMSEPVPVSDPNYDSVYSPATWTISFCTGNACANW